MSLQRQAWSVSALAVEFSLDRRTCAKRLDSAKVQPVARVNDVPRYRLSDVIPILRTDQPADHTIDLPSAQLRRATAEARIKELELGKLSGALLDTETVQQAWADLLLTVRAKLLTLPRLIGSDIEDRSLRIRTEATSDERIRECLELLAQYQPGAHHGTDHERLSPPPGAGATPAAGAETLAQPVGGDAPLSRPRRGRPHAVAEQPRALPD